MGLFVIGLLGLLLWGKNGSGDNAGRQPDEDYFDHMKRTDYGKWKGMKDDSEKSRW